MTSNYDMRAPDQFFRSDQGDYTEHYQSLERGTRIQMDSIVSFILSCPLQGEVKDYVNALIAIGTEDFEARCHRRFGKLRDLRYQLQEALLVYFGEEEGDILDEPEKNKWSESHIMSPLTIPEDLLDKLQVASEVEVNSTYMGKPLYKNPAKQILEKIGEINYLQETIHENDMAGFFKDYTRVSEHFDFPTLDKVYTAAIIKEAPPFIQMAYNVAITEAAGSRIANAQAINAHVVAPDILSFIEQGRQHGAVQGRYMNPAQEAQNA